MHARACDSLHKGIKEEWPMGCLYKGARFGSTWAQGFCVASKGSTTSYIRCFLWRMTEASQGIRKLLPRYDPWTCFDPFKTQSTY